jgi:diamine N-acetyltransferase
MSFSEIYFRSPEPEDLELLYLWENDQEIWKVSQTHAPYSKNTLSQFISSPQDIYVNKQLRLMICLEKTNEIIGCVDWFDYDIRNNRSGIGILISREFRGKGLGRKSLKKALEYAKNHLLLHQIYCDIPEYNTTSIKLFESLGFSLSGTKRHWLKEPKGYVDVRFYQLIF